jgi:hypothetical protein
VGAGSSPSASPTEGKYSASDVCKRLTRAYLRGVPSYLIETFLARGAAGERGSRERRARSAAEDLTQAGTRVRFDRSIHVPEDEICFFLFDAPSSREAALVAEQAALDPIRVVEALSSRKEHR